MRTKNRPSIKPEPAGVKRPLKPLSSAKPGQRRQELDPQQDADNLDYGRHLFLLVHIEAMNSGRSTLKTNHLFPPLKAYPFLLKTQPNRQPIKAQIIVDQLLH